LGSRSDEIPFDLERIAPPRVPADPAPPPTWKRICVLPKLSKRRARIHRKFDLMKQTQDHDGDVRTGGSELGSFKAAWFVDE